MLIVINDITEQKKQEAALIAANDAAQNAIVSRERFLASMSHELRTPIAGVTGLLELLSTRVNGTEKQGLVDNISSSMRHLHMLVNDILDFSKLEAKQLSLELRECNYLKELGNVFRLHNAAALEKKLSLYINITPSNVEMIKIDSLRLSQIVNNLLSNAIKFTEKGHVEILVYFIENKLNIRICDTGVGMNSSQLGGVFKPFTQADNSIARKYGGTGLGLNIVNELVKLMNGELNINSVVGVGTSVDLSIPIEISSYYTQSLNGLNIDCTLNDKNINEWLRLWFGYDFTNELISNKSVKITDNKNEINNGLDIIYLGDENLENDNLDNRIVSINNKPLFIDELYSSILNVNLEQEEHLLDISPHLEGCVLIAEDNKINQKLLVKQLEEFGVMSVVTNNGKEAFDKLLEESERYDALITDCHMPIIDGFTLAEKIREEIPNFSKKAIIGCTAEDLRVSRLNGKTSGFDDMLFKPYGLKELYSILSNRLKKNTDTIDKQFYLNKFIELHSSGLFEIFIETMREDYYLLTESLSHDDFNSALHRIKGGAGSIELQPLVLLINDISNYSFGTDKYKECLNKVILNMNHVINEASEWYELNYD